MPSVIDKLKKIIRSSEWDDQSKALAKDWERMVADSYKLKELQNNEAFQIILEQLKSDFKGRMKELVAGDADLRAIHHMFVRTLGQDGTEKAVDGMIEEFLQQNDVPLE